MTEIPEHLLKRSRDRRAALGLGGGEGGDEAATPASPAAPSTTPATTGDAAPAAAAPSGPAVRKAAAPPAAPPPPKPDPPYVAAAKSRPKIPFWAMATLSLMPIWLFMYVRSVTEAPEVVAGPLGVGAEVYPSKCASCHGPAGGGGAGRPLAGGEVLKTFPQIEDQLRFVYFGTEEYNQAGVDVYGNPDREGGAQSTGSFGVMPQQGSEVGGELTDDEILAVVCHERYTIGGAVPTADEYVEEFEAWCSEEAPAFAALEEGTTLAELADEGITDADGDAIEIIPIGDAPRCRIARRRVTSTDVQRADLPELDAAARELAVEVLVVGGGPAGAAAAYWLARHGHDVTVVEKKQFPREKTCGDGLTPRAVKQLDDMGLTSELERFHRYHGLRATGMGRELELEWPAHPVYPQHGYVVRRRELDEFVAANAERAGATVLTGHEAVRPLVDRGFVRGATVTDDDGQPLLVRSEFTIVADGANSRFGRALGTFRTREWPYGTAIRTYWETPRHADEWIESALDVKDRNGNPMPGYGWIFPVGDGTVNIGVGLLSTFRDFKSVNTTHLLDAYAHQIADRWEIDPDRPQCRATSGRIPMGGSVGPKAGPTYLVIGDAAGSVNPFNGEGIDYAYETARMAADVIHEALVDDDATALQRYPKLIDDEYGQYFKVARLFARIIGRPALMRELTRAGMHSRSLMEWVLRIMANLLRPDEIGPAEAAYKAAAAIVRLAPDA